MKLLAFLDRIKELKDKLDPETEITIRTYFVSAPEDKRISEVFVEERSNSAPRLIIETNTRW